MTDLRRGRLWMAGFLVTMAGWGPANAADVGDPIAAGVKTVGLGGTISISHGTRDGFDTVTGLQLLPNVGMVVADAAGPGWLKGHLEALAEPALTHLDSEVGSSTVVGLSALARWIFAGWGGVRPYVEVGAGVLVGETKLQQTDCSFNFLLQTGPGLLLVLSDATALTVGYRFQHISNGSLCSFNPGINASGLYLGISHLFR